MMRTVEIPEDGTGDFEIGIAEAGVIIRYSVDRRWTSIVLRVPVAFDSGEVFDRWSLLHLLYDSEAHVWRQIEFVTEQ